MVPIVTVFIASFCIMVVELTASRIVARYLGASLYTWASVIGVVLAGIAFGNYFGGRFSDRFPPNKVLSLIFVVASASCAAVPLMNRLVGEFYLFWLLPLSLRTVLHVITVFFVPSAVLGMVAPVITKFALDQQFETGRTVGNMYAWSSVGSIAGACFAGFFLIPRMGSLSVIWSVAGILALLGVVYALFVYAFKPWLSLAWCGILVSLAVVSIGPQGWAQAVGQQLGLREAMNPNVIYQKESQYSYITVTQLERAPHLRKLILNRLLHSIVNVDDPTDLGASYQYPYMRLYAAVTRHLALNKNSLHALIIGGGGYVLPRYLEKTWPGSDIEVVEIDPAVTEAAVQTLGLSRDSSFQIHHRDGRNFVDELVWRKHHGAIVEPFDFIYGDAVSGLSVPYQLTTHEFNQMVRELLAPDGVYLLTVIDSFRSGKFLGAMVNTLQKSFPNVYVFSSEGLADSDYARNTFVVLSSMRSLDLEELSVPGFEGSQLQDAQLQVLQTRSSGIILTDDYAPVNYLLEPTYYQREVQLTSVRFSGLGDQFAKQGNLEKAIRYYRRALEVDPGSAVAHNNLASALARLGKLEEAKTHYQEALRIAPRFAGAQVNLATFLAQEGNSQKATGHYEKALEMDPFLFEAHYNLGTLYSNQKNHEAAREHYEKALELKPDFAQAHEAIGNVLLKLRKFEEAVVHYREAIKLRPESAQVHNNLGAIFAESDMFENAIFHFREALRLDPDYGNAQTNLDAVLSRQKIGDAK